MGMNHLRIEALLVFTVVVAGISAQTPTESSRYKVEIEVRDQQVVVDFFVKEIKGKYEVFGQIEYTNFKPCQIRGSYFPDTRRLRATCTGDGDSTINVDGVKIVGKDAFQIEFPDTSLGTMVAYRDGVKPKGDTSGDTKQPKEKESCTLAGSWTQTTKTVATTTWIISADGIAREDGGGNATGKATLKNNVLHIGWSTKTGYEGYYEWPLDKDCASDNGVLKFEKPRTDQQKSTLVKN